mgnify:CR=1 FL=1
METTASLNNLWSQILALPASDRQWLRDKLDVYEGEEEERLAPYTMEEINAWIDEAEAELEAGEPGYTLEEFDTQMRKEHGWL